MKLFQKLDNELLTAVLVFVISLIGFAVTSFLISTHIDIPLGFVLSGGIIALIYVLSSLFRKIDERRGTVVFSLISITLRLVLTIAAILLLVLMYYKWNIKLFNVFVFVGVYSLGIIIYMITYIKSRKRKE